MVGFIFCMCIILIENGSLSLFLCSLYLGSGFVIMFFGVVRLFIMVFSVQCGVWMVNWRKLNYVLF